ncbi:hypothetical protein Droror1_Dr00009827 [Drosera rotundifolia]
MRDLVASNPIIVGYAKNGHVKIALELMIRMQEERRGVTGTRLCLFYLPVRIRIPWCLGSLFMGLMGFEPDSAKESGGKGNG